MEVLLHALLEVFGELLLQVVFEALAESGLRIVRRRTPPTPPPAWLAAVGYVALGAACGGLSLWPFPHFFVETEDGRVLTLILTPLLAGLAMSALGAWRRARGQELLRLDRFVYGYAFALALAVVRLVFGHAA